MEEYWEKLHRQRQSQCGKDESGEVMNKIKEQIAVMDVKNTAGCNDFVESFKD
ncbi:Hypothetical predicted protein, partial [Olea europaea subsp. europaea]